MIALGTGLSARPPHRSRRAGLPHRTPALGPDGQALVGIGMQDARGWKPETAETVGTRPTGLAFVAAATEDPPPQPLDLPAERTQPTRDPGNRVVAIPSLNNAPKPCARLGHRPMPPSPQVFLDRPKRTTHPSGHGEAEHRERSVTLPAARVREAQEPPRFLLVLEAHHEVIGIANHHDIAARVPITPARSHFFTWRITRESAIRCPRNRISHSWSMASKKPRMSASSTQLIFRCSRPTANASNAPWALRPGRNPYEKPRKSSSYTAPRTSAVERWTILSSSVGIPIGRCRPSALGIQTRLTGRARYAPRWSLDAPDSIVSRLHTQPARSSADACVAAATQSTFPPTTAVVESATP